MRRGNERTGKAGEPRTTGRDAAANLVAATSAASKVRAAQPPRWEAVGAAPKMDGERGVPISVVTEKRRKKLKGGDVVVHVNGLATAIGVAMGAAQPVSYMVRSNL